MRCKRCKQIIKQSQKSIRKMGQKEYHNTCKGETMNYTDRITKRLMEIREDRDSKRAQGLKDGTLTIVLDNNGIPIVVPVDQPILTLADRFHELTKK